MTTQNRSKTRIMLATGVALTCLGYSGLASAQAVTSVSVMEPTGVIYVSGFPAPVDVVLRIDARNNPGNCANAGIAEIIVGATGTAPFDTRVEILNDDDPTLVDGDNNVIDNDNVVCPGFYSFLWQVPRADTYDLDVFVRRGNTEGDTDEEVTFVLELVSVEYPAPPSVANAYINGDPNLKSLHGKQRGCVISKVAGKHAKLAGTAEGYGPKGGPYDQAAIEQDVIDFFQECPTR